MLKQKGFTMNPKRWVFIRGLTRSKFHWLGFDEYFKRELEIESVECPEVAGNGYLSHEISSVSLDETVLQLKSQIQSIKEPIGLFGISMGGMIATRWVQMFPDEVSRLVLVNTSSSLNPFYQRLRPENYSAIAIHLFQKNPEKIEHFLMSLTSNDESRWLLFLPDLIAFRQKHPITSLNFIRQLRLSSQSVFSQKPLDQILILASEQDRLVNSECSRTIARAWECPLEMHPSAGHDLSLDDPSWIVKQVKVTR
jgi:pimeloyl-ACP methyl ester carboxylesterase